MNQPDRIDKFIQTVTGRVPASEIGFTLCHEHLYIQLWEVRGRYDGRHQLEDDSLLADELAVFKAQGGTCVVDLTVPGLGRKPERLKALSERTGLRIVMGCGWYREPYYPPEHLIERRSVQSLADQIISEITEGVEGTGIRPGVIGEIGADKGWVSPIEERVHRAAARAQVETGYPLATHGVLSDVGLQQLSILKDEGVDLTRVTVGHCDSYPHLDYWLRIVEQGAYVAIDNIGSIRAGRHEERIVGLIFEMVERGFGSQLMLSHDVDMDLSLVYFGGTGFGYLADAFLPRLREQGVSEETITQLTVDNPRRWLTIGT